MAIRCSIVGCEYEDTHIEREEERRGEEVILTVREFKECRRCGNTELISENTGITSVPKSETRTEGESEPAPTAETAESEDGQTGPVDEAITEVAPGESTTEEPTPEVTDDAVVLDADSGADPAPTADAGTADPDATGDPDTPDPATDEDTAGPTVVEPGGFERTDWPDQSTETAPTGDADAEGDTGGEDEGEVTDDAVFIDGTGDRTGGLDEAAAMDDGPTITGSDAEEEYPEDDAVILESSGDDSATGVGVGGGEWSGEEAPTTAGGWPEYDDHGQEPAEATAGGWPDADGDDEGWDATAGSEGASDVEFDGLTPTDGGAVAAERPRSGESEAVDPASADGATRTTGETAGAGESAGDLVCTGCGNAVDRESSPHRAGDVCPDCSREYLEER